MKPNTKSAYLILAAALLAGIVFRFLWPLDIEMKFDEAETFNYLRDWVRGDIAFPWVGQPSSNGLRHPGLGIWLFLFFGKLFSVETIVELARVPPVLAVLNMLLLLAFGHFCLRLRARWFLWWAVALMAVNPYLVLMDRKMWHPSVMGIFVSGFFLGWLKRRRPLGSFFLGLCALLPGQIHMSGFFLVLGFGLFDLIYNRWESLRTIRWPAFAGGFFCGLLPMLPWLYWLTDDLGKDGNVSSKLARIFGFKFQNYWLTNAFGVLGPYPFGTGIYFHPVYGMVLALSLLAAVAGGYLFVRRIIRFFRRKQRAEGTQAEMFSFAGTGLIAALSLMHIPRYFMLCLGYVPYLSAVRSILVLKRGRRILAGMLAVQAVASLFLLSYVHFMPFPADGNVERAYGVFGKPIRECGVNCDGTIKLDRISGGEEIVPVYQNKSGK